MNQLPEQIYTISQVAKLVEIHPKTLRRWEQTGRFQPHRTLGNQRRYTNQDIATLKLIKSGKISTSSPTDRLLSLQQTAQKLKVSPATIRRWTREKKLKLTIDEQNRQGYSEKAINKLITLPQTTQAVKTVQTVQSIPSLSQPLPSDITPSHPASRFDLIPWLKNPSAQRFFIYTTIASIFLTVGIATYLYLNRPEEIASPSIQQLDIAPEVEIALPRVASFLDGNITIGTNTGSLAFIDDQGNLYAKNAILAEDSLNTTTLNLLPIEKPDGQVGRQYVDKDTGNLMYFDGVDWVSINQSTSSANLSLQDIYDTGNTAVAAENQDIDITLGNTYATASATSLKITLAGQQSRLVVLGGTGQEVLTIDDDGTYPVTINQSVKATGNIYGPKFIDTYSTSYFLDPSATGLGLSIAGNATISATLKFSQYGEYLTNSVDGYIISSGGLGVAGGTTYGFDTEGDLKAREAEVSSLTTNGTFRANNNTYLGDGDDTITINTDQMIIKSTGNIGIGTTSPISKLHLSGVVVGKALAIFDGTGNQDIFTASASGIPKFVIDSSGFVGINMIDPSVELDVTGDIEYTGTITDVSDIRLKENIVPLEDSLEKLLTLEGFTFNLIDNDNVEIGLSAQDVQLVFPEAVNIIDKEGHLGLSYTELIPPIIEAIKELNNQFSSIFSSLQTDLLRAGIIITDSLNIQDQPIREYIADVVNEISVDNQDNILSPTVETEILTTKFISPLADDGQITITGPVTIANSEHTKGSEPALIVKGSASISGRLDADEVVADRIVTDELIASKIKASTIEGLRDKIAGLVDKYREGTATGSAIPESLEIPFTTLLAVESSEPYVSTDSAYLDITSINADFGFFSDYLAVMGTASITDLKVNNTLAIGGNLVLTSTSISSLDNQLYLQPSGLGAINLLAGLMVLDQSGQVTVNGDLNVSGGLTAKNASVSGSLIASQIDVPINEDLEINIASQSAVSIYNDILSSQVASIDASGSGSFSSLNLKAAGNTIIPAGENHVIVSASTLSENSQVIITFGSSYSPATKYWVVKDPIKEQFIIYVNYPVSHNTTIDWLIIN